ncbi:MAG: hypothetical protein RLZZ618_2277 [Pseudomonadota bacterium]|jgi:pimeloyl-ACP methyl ester carboxylesterase
MILFKSLLTLALRRARKQAGLKRHKATMPSGVTWSYLDGGSGVPLVLLHGFGGNKDAFVRVAGHLTGTQRVISPDLPGFGESDHTLDDYAPIAQAHRLHEFIQSLGLGPVDIGGNSMGGHIALTYASLYPQHVRHLWLLNAGGMWSAPKGEFQLHLEATGRNMLVARNAREYAEVLSFVMFAPPKIPRPVLRVLAKERMANQALEQRIFEQATADSVEDRARGLPMPSLIVWGEKDRVFPASTGTLLHELLPNSQLIVMAGVGHVPMMESAERCAADYRAFTASHPVLQ